MHYAAAHTDSIKDDAMKNPLQRIWKPLTLTLFACASPLYACGPAVEPLGEGAVSLSWEVLPGGCEQEGVEEIEISLEPTRGAPVTNTFRCRADDASIDVLAGNYKLDVRGLDSRSRAVVGAPTREIAVSDGFVTELGKALELTALPGSVQIGWRFADGRVCGAHGVSEIELTVFDDASFQIARDRFTCNDGAGVVLDLPQQTYMILGRASGVDGQEVVRFEGTVEVGVKRGSETSASLVLERSE